MGPEIVQFYGKGYEETASGKILRIHQITVPIIFQNPNNFFDRILDVVHPVKILFPPDFTRFTEDIMKKVLFVFEIIEKTALGNGCGFEDVIKGGVEETVEGKQPQRLIDDLLFTSHHGIFPRERQTGRSVFKES
jgi:hypothetical protein